MQNKWHVKAPYSGTECTEGIANTSRSGSADEKTTGEKTTWITSFNQSSADTLIIETRRAIEKPQISCTVENWKWTGIKTGSVFAGGRLIVEHDLSMKETVERIFVPLVGNFLLKITFIDGTESAFELEGRKNLFAETTDVLYIGINVQKIEITGQGSFAIAEAKADKVFPMQYIAKKNVPVELRGGGQASRQVQNFGTPAVMDAQKIIACEVITPSGNWSSYPQHKHDKFEEGVQSNLEEIYYFQVRKMSGAVSSEQASLDPLAYQVVDASDEREIKVRSAVRSGDIIAMPYGWHGPSMAPFGYDLYYLNVMAGPDEQRVWNVVFRPEQKWLIKQFEKEEIDKRLPMSE